MFQMNPIDLTSDSDEHLGESSAKRKEPSPPGENDRARHPTAKVQEDDASSAAGVNLVDDPSDSVKQKIQKLLETASNAGATESERQNAMLIAKKLMARIGITESDMRSSNASNALEMDKLVRGKTRVKIFDTKVWSSWFNNLASFACTLCSVGSSYQIQRMEMTFYGVKDRTVMAASAFEVMFNRMPTIMSARPSTIRGTAEKNSYRIGIIHGLIDSVKNATRHDDDDDEEEDEEEQNEIRTLVAIDTVAKKVVDDMKASMKLKKPRRVNNKFDRSAYNIGLEDSKKIDIAQDRLQ